MSAFSSWASQHYYWRQSDCCCCRLGVLTLQWHMICVINDSITFELKWVIQYLLGFSLGQHNIAASCRLLFLLIISSDWFLQKSVFLDKQRGFCDKECSQPDQRVNLDAVRLAGLFPVFLLLLLILQLSWRGNICLLSSFLLSSTHQDWLS